MNKGERTKLNILQKATPIFNERGYFGTSMSDITRATGLQKGSIYRYFETKDDLAIAAFDFAYDRMKERYKRAIVEHKNAADRLKAIIKEHSSIMSDPYLAGGCPILNTAVVGDDAHPALLKRAQQAMDDWRFTLQLTLEKGMQRKEIQTIDVEAVVSIVTSALEGAIVLAKLYEDHSHIERMVEHLNQYIEHSVAV